MATQPKIAPPLTIAAPVLDGRRIGQLAERVELFQAQRWFARERNWINEIHLQLCRIAAPTFFEQARAEWFAAQLTSLGWESTLDRAGNVLATFGYHPFIKDGQEGRVVVSAHLDTVLAPSRPEEIHYGPDGRLMGPGTSDNGSGLVALLALARVLSETPGLEEIAASIVLVANVGEEGEGNLSGMRYLCRHHPRANLFKAFLVLDGPSSEHVTAQALASRRFEISFNGPGGHSWNDYGKPNPVHAISEVISGFVREADSRLAMDRRIRCSYNFGIVEGGSSVNAIPASARAKLDLRSEEPALLDELAGMLSICVERALENGNRTARQSRLTAKVRELGTRPGGRLAENSPLLRTIQAVDQYLSIRSRVDCASTDANVPLSMGLPAVSVGAGGSGGGAHTNEEWYSPEGREQGLRRILLILAALQDTAALESTAVLPT